MLCMAPCGLPHGWHGVPPELHVPGLPSHVPVLLLETASSCGVAAAYPCSATHQQLHALCGLMKPVMPCCCRVREQQHSCRAAAEGVAVAFGWAVGLWLLAEGFCCWTKA